MSDDTTAMPPAPGGTSWPRFALILLPALAAAALLVALTGRGSIAASFAVSGHRFKVSADELRGQGFAQYGDVAVTAGGVRRPVAISVIDAATLVNLCQSVLMDTPAGQVTFLIRAGRGERPVRAEHLVIDLRQLSGDAEFTGIQIGRDAGTLENATGATGGRGAFGQQAATVRVRHLRQTAYAVNAGTFTLAGLDLSVRRGDHECF
ncbi:cholesterol esterase [Sphaerisporangium melleum]|uniref:Cholesterol esterase n=1 Tax=Sphaerisporangium melleum TaxID=321316 RepID=A0A917RLW4_9ACTN|nr:DUF6230 family protein [Sphaerisporangium melleum]GGL13841.1 cholesterol esterase [Sphaerisporangium melleum]GII74624.1 cholesterol esterase [Sphaerisporangium melleum]